MFKYTLKFSKRTYWWLLISGLLGALGWMANSRSNSPQLLTQYASRLSEYYQEQEQKVAPILADTSYWQKIYQNSRRPYTISNEAEIAFLQEWSDKPVVWMLFRAHVPVFWTDNTLIIPDSILDRHYRAESGSAERLNTGFFVLNSHRFRSGSDSLLLIGAVAIKYTYPIEGPYLKEEFAPGTGVLPDELTVGLKGEVPVLGPEAAPLFYLSAADRPFDPVWHLPALIFFLTGLLFFLLAVNDLANYTARRFHPWIGAGLIIGVVLLLKVLLDWLGFSAAFSGFPFLEELFDTFIFNQSLGVFFLSSVVLFWLMVFFHREFSIELPTQIASPWPVIFTTVTYSLSIISLLVIVWLFQQLIMKSGLIFDFEYIFGFDFRTFLGLTSGLIVILSVFLFNHRLLQTTSRLGTGLSARLLAVLAAILISSPVFYAIEVDISPIIVLIMAFVYVIGLDYTLDRPSLSLTTAVVWLLFFALFTSIIIHEFRQKQDLATKRNYTKVLTDPQDIVLEEAVRRLLVNWDRGNSPRAILGQYDSLPIAQEAIIPLIQADFATEPYLFQHYEFQLLGIDRQNGQPLIEGQLLGEGMRLLELRASAAPSTVDHLSYWPKPNQQNFTYLLELAPTDTSTYLLLALRHRSPRDQRVYDDLLQFIPYKKLAELPLYDYAIYGGPRTLKQSGKLPSRLRPLPSSLEADDYKLIDDEERATLIYKSENGFTALISRQKEERLQLLSLFSFLFSLLVLMVIFLSVLNYYWQALPHTFEFSSFQRASLRNRIQRAILLLIVGSFVLVGFFTAGFFRRNALQAGSEQLNEKVQAVLSDLQRNLSNQEDKDTIGSLQYLSPLIRPTADIHDMDINIYDLQGRLQLTSANFLFQRQISAPLMNPVALQGLRLPTQPTYRGKEKIGYMAYQSAYVPIRDSNEEIIAYLELPYYTNVRELRNDLQAFLSALLNVYVFLLLIAGAIALFVAESITQPISKIGQKLSQFRLGHNEPLEWKSPDEIGQLIAEYNRMIQKLEESAEKLRQSEREGAWREMAKQVAHEIKNPLTPMKLTIQHLLRIQQQDPKRASNMLSEVAQSIIQQIDGLSRIAEEFSNFAKMPQAQNEQFILNELVTSVYNLYAKGNDHTTELQLDLPEETLEVFADPNQLMRVINNLIKNALQAIPDERKGLVEIKLEKRDDEAVLSVTDNGSGIPKSLQERVFFPNFTTKNSGMGLGLAMSRSIVNAAGGNIYFETQEDKGTTFYVELPLHTNNVEA